MRIVFHISWVMYCLLVPQLIIFFFFLANLACVLEYLASNLNVGTVLNQCPVAVVISKRINIKCLPRAHFTQFGCQSRSWYRCTFLITISYSPWFSKVAWSIKHVGNSCSWWTDHVLEYSDIFEVMDLLEECMCK